MLYKDNSILWIILCGKSHSCMDNLIPYDMTNLTMLFCCIRNVIIIPSSNFNISYFQFNLKSIQIKFTDVEYKLNFTFSNIFCHRHRIKYGWFIKICKHDKTQLSTWTLKNIETNPLNGCATFACDILL